jgi:hypothetical protein
LIYRDWTDAAMAANFHRGWTGAARDVAANYCRWLGSAMAANYRDWCGDYCKLYCCSDGCERGASAASYRGWTGLAMVASKQLRLNWCGDGCKLRRLDRSGDGCKSSAAGLVQI